ncbi:Phage P2 baseplate assembly protein gpV [Bordetella ansorpii]|uniref:Phage P2 baseplate assembly protein gpV n=1 Tax=Bordetella ansorpii TaxID=288768 RepID=A0A157QPG6_9BORD|nr:GPW/gp25 family protein [Bordetella ansorpii]SAI47464.1 Phage P2 baseplate assembly protein gpV [Bordetella ansorpii]
MSGYLGMDATTGRRITGRAHLAQSLTKILTTSIGSRLRRRPFGSLVPDSIDAPGNRAALLQIYAAAASAIMAWEPRIQLRGVTAQPDPAQPGRYYIDVQGEAVIDGAPQSVRIAAPLSGLGQG